jgi:hypothetical protein
VRTNCTDAAAGIVVFLIVSVGGLLYSLPWERRQTCPDCRTRLH